ncbi:hypothetical protein [Xenorhabdus bovienii]|uniref:Uncharacterized protein n=1 Tax=Xenorhabdus bovienii str. feltiae Moldova TaxID=1398200 RepID=A0A077NWM0_XENBV|nr:hypothetical protein [Xenorhabdus bovienii]CDH02823.1 conserved hypothetical protein [Xenorhabdus bovienii str. feltiae Moldova]
MMEDEYQLPIFGYQHNNIELGHMWANACVGDNGFNIDNYYHGYIKASKILLESILGCKDADINPENQISIDALIYPICFNLRHAVELIVKKLSEVIINIFENRNFKYKSVAIPKINLSSHDIKKIWENIKPLAIDSDIRFNKILNKIEPFILEISRVDTTGQTFRYFLDNENNEHLKKIRIIPTILLYKNVKVLESDLSKLNDIFDDLIMEYNLGTFTKKLSRDRIEQLAKDLPLKKHWGTSLTQDIKKKLKSKYDIGSKEFSEAINIIQSHYEFSRYVGESIKLKFIEKNMLFTVLDIWAKTKRVDEFFKIKSPNVISSWEEVAEIEKIITLEFSSELYTLFCYGGELDGSECYIYRLEKRLDNYNSDKSWMIVDLQYLLGNKPDLVTKLIISLSYLNQDNLALKLKERYDRYIMHELLDYYV